MMNVQKIKKAIFAAALTFGLVATAGLSLAQAQWPINRNLGWQQQRERERQRQWEWEQRQRNRNNYPYGGYGNNRNSAEVQRGYRDGLDRGQEDFRGRRRADPNNSSHFRNGNSAYREGFRQGYREGYRSYGYRGW